MQRSQNVSDVPEEPGRIDGEVVGDDHGRAIDNMATPVETPSTFAAVGVDWRPFVLQLDGFPVNPVVA
ncbi:hypothetical protein [Nocardia fluminea]|uniref:hypothetical protein n=1 Tax=Nocardia fluminea TaxID=134984 RepID=UPI003665660E